VAWQSRVIDPGRHTAEGVEPAAKKGITFYVSISKNL